MWKPTSIILFVMPVFVTAGQAEDSRRNPHYAYAHQGGLTAPDSSPPREIASRYLRGRAVELGLQDADLSGLYLVKDYRTEHNGVTHLHYRQRFQGMDVERSNYVLNIDREGRVISTGGSLFPEPQGVKPPAETSAPAAVHAAVKAVDPKLAANFKPARKSTRNSMLSFERGPLGEEPQTQSVWYAVRGQLQPAWKVQVIEPDGRQAWSVVVEAGSAQVLQKGQLNVVFRRRAEGLRI